jgi:hypothetical protein
MDYYGFTLKELGLKHSEDIDGFVGHIIEDGFYEKLVIIGFPYDHIIKLINRDELKIGSHYGPDSWRRFIHTWGTTDNREYGIRIDNIRIADYGNIVAHNSTLEFNLEENQRKLFIKCLLTFERNQVNFVMGGTRDFTPYVSKALMSHKIFSPSEESSQKYNKSLLISLSHWIDAEEVSDGLLTPFNRHTYVIEMPEFHESGSNLVILGTKEDYSSLSIPNWEIIQKSTVISQNPEWVEKLQVPILTEMGKFFYNFLKEKCKTYSCVQVDLNVQSVLGEESTFTTEEILEILFVWGYFNEVKSFNVSEYNPRIEDIITGQFWAEIFYFFTLGVEIREKNAEEKFVKPAPKVKNIFTDGS